MPEQFKQLIRCKWCDWTGLSRQALYAHRKAHHPDTFNAVIQPDPVVTTPPLPPPPPIAPIGPLKAPEPRDVVVGAADDYPVDETDDEPLFDGDNQEIPVVFIFVAVFALMIISGAVIFREKIIEFFRRRGKPPAYGVPNYAG